MREKLIVRLVRLFIRASVESASAVGQRLLADRVCVVFEAP